MDYEKKYKEALDRARIYRDNAKAVEEYSAVARYENIFPELRESEDERIRRTLVEYFGPQAQLDFIRGVPIQKIRDWLEKQKEQIPYIDFVIKPHKGDDNNPYDMRVSEAQEYAIKRGFGIPFNDGEVYVDERHLTQTIGNILRWADEHPKEQKPAEWSEEDENKIERLAFLVSVAAEKEMISEEECIDLRRFVKSYCPSWRPSESQMYALKVAIETFRVRNSDNISAGNDKVFTQIESLYKDLKKL